MYKDCLPSLATIYNYVTDCELKCGCTSLEHDSHQERENP